MGPSGDTQEGTKSLVLNVRGKGGSSRRKRDRSNKSGNPLG